MTNEEVLDWLYRIKSKLKIYFPREWVSKCELVIDYAIKAIQENSKLKEDAERWEAYFEDEVANEW